MVQGCVSEHWIPATTAEGPTELFYCGGADKRRKVRIGRLALLDPGVLTPLLDPGSGRLAAEHFVVSDSELLTA